MPGKMVTVGMEKKKKALGGILVLCLLLGLGCQGGNKERTAAKKDADGTITISGAWALYPMAVKWAEEFQKLHPGIKIDVAAGGAGKGMADALAGIADIGAVSRDLYPAEIEKGAWGVPVVEDAVVPTINEGNPLLDELLRVGATKEAFIGIWVTGRLKSWGGVVGRGGEQPIRVYTRSDACGAAETWAKYLGKKQDDLLGVGVYGDPGVAEAIRSDALGIGFNNINYAYDPTTRKPVAGIRVLPIDLNGDGRIDANEDFYGSRDEIVQAIAAGVYPSPPARDLYFVSRGKPQKKVVVEFITWALTEGQRYVAETGYVNLSEEKLEEGLRSLAE
jgi:phosphate transport system substrate-binding protein